MVLEVSWLSVCHVEWILFRQVSCFFLVTPSWTFRWIHWLACTLPEWTFLLKSPTSFYLLAATFSEWTLSSPCISFELRVVSSATDNHVVKVNFFVGFILYLFRALCGKFRDWHPHCLSELFFVEFTMYFFCGFCGQMTDWQLRRPSEPFVEFICSFTCPCGASVCIKQHAMS